MFDLEFGFELEFNLLILKFKFKLFDLVFKSFVKLKFIIDKGFWILLKEFILICNVKDVKDRKNCFEYGRRERIEKGWLMW